MILVAIAAIIFLLFTFLIPEGGEGAWLGFMIAIFIMIVGSAIWEPPVKVSERSTETIKDLIVDDFRCNLIVVTEQSGVHQFEDCSNLEIIPVDNPDDRGLTVIKEDPKIWYTWVPDVNHPTEYILKATPEELIPD